MRLSELIKAAQEALAEHGDPDMQVMVYADHGQEDERVYAADVQNIDEDGCGIHPDDIKEGVKYNKAFIICGE